MISSNAQNPAKPGRWWLWFNSFIAILIAIIITAPLASRLDPVIGDLLLLQQQKSVTDANEDIVIVTITEDTLAGFPYRSPINRQFLAELIETIDSRAPRSIGFDILLDSPSDPVNDQLLVEAIGKVKAPFVVANSPLGKGLTPKQFAYLNEVLRNRLSGSIILQRDEIDGVVRHLPNIRDDAGNPIPTFASMLANPKNISVPNSGRLLYQPGHEGASGTFPKYPAHTVALLPDQWFTDKIILIGTDLPSTDRHLAPVAAPNRSLDGSLPGVEVHAHILAQTLAGRSLPILSLWHHIILIALCAFITVLIFALVSKPQLFFIGLLVAISTYAVVCYILIEQEVLLLPLAGPPAAVILVTLLASLSQWWQDRSERAFLETAFSQYVSKTIVKRLSNGDIKLSLGGEKRKVTYLFTDLEGFTSLSQSLPPDQMVSLLNVYLDNICEIITAHGATIDKIIGDAVVCFFGAPESDQNQVENGVKLTLALDKFCEEFRIEANKKGTPVGVTRIGLHFGEAIVGNFGGKRFFDYTGIGDTVNIAARLEGANRYLGTRICVSDSIVEHCPDVSFRPLGNLVLKGRDTAIACFEPCSAEVMSSPWMQKYLGAFQQLELKEPNTINAFEQVIAINPEDGPSQFHLNRLRDGVVDLQVMMWEK